MTRKTSPNSNHKNTQVDALKAGFLNLSQKQTTFKTNLETLILEIFRDYKKSTFENQENVNLLRSYYLFRKICGSDNDFIQVFKDKKDAVVSEIDKIIKNNTDDFSLTNHEIESNIGENLEHMQQKGSDVVLQDILKIFQELVDEYVKEMKTTNPSESDDIKDVSISDTVIDETQKKNQNLDTKLALMSKKLKFVSVNFNKRFIDYNRLLFNEILYHQKLSQHINFHNNLRVKAPKNRLNIFDYYLKLQRRIRVDKRFSKKFTEGIMDFPIEKSIIQGSILAGIKGIFQTLARYFRNIGRRLKRELTRKIKKWFKGWSNKHPILGNIILGGFLLLKLTGGVVKFLTKIFVGIWGHIFRAVWSIAKFTAKFVWKYTFGLTFNILKEAVGLVKNMTVSFSRSGLFKMFLRFLATPQGGFLLGVVGGLLGETTRHLFDRAKDNFDKLKERMNREYNIEDKIRKVMQTMKDLRSYVSDVMDTMNLRDIEEYLNLSADSILYDFLPVVLREFSPDNIKKIFAKKAAGTVVGLASSVALSSLGFSALLPVVGASLLMAGVAELTYTIVDTSKKIHENINTKKKLGYWGSKISNFRYDNNNKPKVGFFNEQNRARILGAAGKIEGGENIIANLSKIMQNKASRDARNEKLHKILQFIGDETSRLESERDSIEKATNITDGKRFNYAQMAFPINLIYNGKKQTSSTVPFEIENPLSFRVYNLLARLQLLSKLREGAFSGTGNIKEIEDYQNIVDNALQISSNKEVKIDFGDAGNVTAYTIDLQGPGSMADGSLANPFQMLQEGSRFNIKEIAGKNNNIASVFSSDGTKKMDNTSILQAMNATIGHIMTEARDIDLDELQGKASIGELGLDEYDSFGTEHSIGTTELPEVVQVMIEMCQDNPINVQNVKLKNSAVNSMNLLCSRRFNDTGLEIEIDGKMYTCRFQNQHIKVEPAGLVGEKKEKTFKEFWDSVITLPEFEQLFYNECVSQLRNWCVDIEPDEYYMVSFKTKPVTGTTHAILDDPDVYWNINTNPAYRKKLRLTAWRYKLCQCEKNSDGSYQRKIKGTGSASMEVDSSPRYIALACGFDDGVLVNKRVVDNQITYSYSPVVKFNQKIHDMNCSYFMDDYKRFVTPIIKLFLMTDLDSEDGKQSKPTNTLHRISDGFSGLEELHSAMRAAQDAAEYILEKLHTTESERRYIDNQIEYYQNEIEDNVSTAHDAMKQSFGDAIEYLKGVMKDAQDGAKSGYNAIIGHGHEKVSEVRTEDNQYMNSRIIAARGSSEEKEMG